MHENLFFNDKFVSVSEANLSAISSAALYGKGIFTTVAIRNKKPFLWEKHWRRLRDNALKIGVDISEISEVFLIDSLNKLIKKNEIENARARISFFDERASEIWTFETKRKTSVLITTADLRETSEDFRLTISPFLLNSASPLAGVKSCNYLENILALDEAKRRGFDEAIRLNERGEIASACMANIFWRKNGKLFTPDLKTGCLAGTTREFVLENENGTETTATLQELKRADEIFLTSAGLGICRVSDFSALKKE